jgi:ATP-dependent helicase HrpB
MFPDQITTRIEHLFDRTHKRVAAIKLIRFHDLVIHQEHEREVDPIASGRCLADAFGKQYFELPQLNHEVKQFIARVNLVSTAMPDLELPAFDGKAITEALTRAFAGMTLVKEAQAAPLRNAIIEQFGKDKIDWLNELAPLNISWHDGRKLKLLYPEQARDEDGEPNSPEVQVKITECFALKDHPHICEGNVPVKLWLCSPDGKRIESTFNWPAFKTNTYPKLKPVLQRKFPGNTWI